MRYLAITLGILFLLLQYDLWFGEGSLGTAWQLQSSIGSQQAQNQRLQTRNQTLEAEVKDLKAGKEAIEERARSELGMVKENETFYQVIEE